MWDCETKNRWKAKKYKNWKEQSNLETTLKN